MRRQARVRNSRPSVLCLPLSALPPRVRASARLRVSLLALFLFPFSFFLFPSAASASGWARQQTGSLAWLRGVYFLDARTGWAVGGRGVVLKTTDGGGSWKQLPRPTEDSLRDVYFADADAGWLVCDKDAFAPQAKGEPRSYLMRTTDGGLSWSRVRATGADANVRLVRVVFADPLRGWTFGETGALYATRDGGGSWARQTLPTRHLLLGGQFLAARRGWLVGAGFTVVRTDDGGETWRPGRLEASDGLYAARADAAARTSVAGAANLSDASNAGAQASPSRVSARLHAVSFVDERRGWAVGAAGLVFHTTDGGRTWRAQDSGVEANLYDVKFFAGGEGYVAGEGGTLLHTTDGGARWTTLPTRTTLTLERLFFVGPARGWAVGSGGVVLARTTE